MQTDEGLLRITLERCTLCGLCVQVCRPGALEMDNDGPRVAHADRCGGCGLCEELCPEGAIECEFEIVW